MAKTKALISFAVTAKLICVFVFAYENCWFSHGKAHFLNAHVTQYMYKQVSSSVIKFLINQKKALAKPKSGLLTSIFNLIVGSMVALVVEHCSPNHEVLGSIPTGNIILCP